jgi:hypothetical protein
MGNLGVFKKVKIMQKNMLSSSQVFLKKESKIAISKFLNSKIINLLLKMVHVVYQYSSMKCKQINSKN